MIHDLRQPLGCLLCGGPGDTGLDVCRPCLRDLPWLEHGCRQCGLPLNGASLICGSCLHRPPAFDRTHPLWHYRPPVPGLIQALKFRGRLDCARLLGELMAERLRGTPLPDHLVPVPLHPVRHRQRGFNQALEIARPIARCLRVRLSPRLCRRVRTTPPQHCLDARERRSNLRGAFQAPADLSGCHIAILDDVMTTGTTAHEMATALKRAGAIRVEVWVLARA